MPCHVLPPKSARSDFYKNKIASEWENRIIAGILIYTAILLGILLIGITITKVEMATYMASFNACPTLHRVLTPTATADDREIIMAEVSAYTSEVNQTDDDPFTMASGKHVYDGAIACPDRFPFGTKVEIDGKVYTCEDRMNARYRDGNYFDIWMSNKAEAINFGRQTKQIIIK